MTPIGQHFLIHFIYPPLWLWNTEHLGNSPRKLGAEPDPALTHTHTHQNKPTPPLPPPPQFVAAEPSMKIMSDFCRCFPASIMGPPGAACNYSWRVAEQMRGLWVRLRWVSGSLGNRRCLLRIGGICAAPVDRAAPHLLPDISCLSLVVFVLGVFIAVPPASLSPQFSPLHEKAPAEPFSPSTSWKSSLVSSILISYLRHRLTRTPAPTASLNILNLAPPPHLRAQAPLADGKTHRWFIIPSFLPLTKHRAHIWRLPLDPFILFRGPGTVAESDWYRLNSYPAYCEQPFVFMKSKYLPLRWASTAHRRQHWKLKCW